jgi:hypothetical protein
VRTRVTAGLVVVILTAVLPGGAAAAATTGPKWTAVPAVPLPDGATAGVLEDVTVVSPTDVWAVGAWADTGLHPITVHWDGSAWTWEPVPDSVGSTGVHRLSAVDGLAADQVWAVAAAPSEVGEVAAALHYDGVAWHTVPVPSTSPDTSTTLSDVDMLSTDDGWAVGEVTAWKAPTQPYVLRWRQGQWTPVPTPAGMTDAGLESVFAAAPDDVWAVGSRRLTTGRRVALVLHWNGAAWAELAPPDGGRSDSLVSVAASPGGEVWAVGSSCAIAVPAPCASLVLRGSKGVWQAVPADNDTAVLNEVVALSANEVWLIGHIFNPALPQVDHAEFWNGQRFDTDDTLLTPVPTGPGAVTLGKPASAHALAAAAVDTVSHVIWAVGWSLGPPELPHAVFRS